jgi:hypothetical protein
MHPQTYNRETVETIPFGNLTLSIIGSALWAEEDRARRLNDTITDIINLVDEEGRIPASHVLRLLVVASDFPTEVAKWQQQLGQAEGISSENTAGKTLSWGSGEPESTYSVITLSEGVALGLIEGDTKLKSIAIQTLIHELAHVHTDYLFLRLFGPPSLEQSDWAGIRQFIALSTLAEFFSESIALLYVEDYEFFEEFVSLGTTILQDAQQQIEQGILTFQKDRDIVQLWKLAVYELSKAFNQLGRSIGYLAAARHAGNDCFNQFFEDVNRLSPLWESVVGQLVDELDTLANQENWDLDSFNGLYDIIEQGFLAAGIQPRPLDQGLEVLYRPLTS